MVKSISLFFPAYNEEGNINKTVSNAVRFLSGQKFPWEIVVVDDGSTDKTGRVADELATRYRHFRVVHTPNGGYGHAIRTGLGEAKSDWVAYTDADGQFDIRELANFFPKVDTCDAIWGYRRKRRDPIPRRLFGAVWAVFLLVFFGIKLRDPNCGFKMFSRGILTKISPLTATRGAMINAELAIKIAKVGGRIAQVGVSHFPRKFGKSTGASLPVVVNSFLELARIRFENR